MSGDTEKSVLYKTISKLCIDRNITVSQLASSLGMTPQGFYRRLQTGKLSYEELQAIAEKLGCTFAYNFAPNNATLL